MIMSMYVHVALYDAANSFIDFVIDIKKLYTYLLYKMYALCIDVLNMHAM